MKKQSKKQPQKTKAEAGDGESSCPPRKRARISKKKANSQPGSQERNVPKRTGESVTPKKLVPTFGKKKAVSKAEDIQSSLKLDEEVKVQVAESSTDKIANNNNGKPKNEGKTSTGTEDNNKRSDNPANPNDEDLPVEKEEVRGKNDIGEEEHGEQTDGEDLKNGVKTNNSGSKAGLLESGGCDGTEIEGQNCDMRYVLQVGEETNGDNEKEINKLNKVSEQKTISSESKDSTEVNTADGTQEYGSTKDQEKVSETKGIIQEETDNCSTDAPELAPKIIDNAMEIEADLAQKDNKDVKVMRESETDAIKSMTFQMDIPMEVDVDNKYVKLDKESVSIVQISELKDGKSSSQMNAKENTMNAESNKENSKVLNLDDDNMLLKASGNGLNEVENDRFKNVSISEVQESKVEVEKTLINRDKSDAERSTVGLETDEQDACIESAQTNSKQNESAGNGKVVDKSTTEENDANDLCSRASTKKSSVEQREEETKKEDLHEIETAGTCQEKSVTDCALGELGSLEAKSEVQSEDVLQDDDFTFSQMCHLEEQCLAADAQNRSIAAKITPIQTQAASSSVNLVEPTTVPQVPSPWKSQPHVHKASPLSLPELMYLPLGPSSDLRPGDLKAASVIQGVITELNELNRMILNAKKQIDAVKRQHQQQQQKQQHSSPRKQQLRQQKLPMPRPTYQQQQRPQQFTPSGTSRK